MAARHREPKGIHVRNIASDRAPPENQRNSRWWSVHPCLNNAERDRKARAAGLLAGRKVERAADLSGECHDDLHPQALALRRLEPGWQSWTIIRHGQPVAVRRRLKTHRDVAARI